MAALTAGWLIAGASAARADSTYTTLSGQIATVNGAFTTVPIGPGSSLTISAGNPTSVSTTATTPNGSSVTVTALANNGGTISVTSSTTSNAVTIRSRGSDASSITVDNSTVPVSIDDGIVVINGVFWAPLPASLHTSFDADGVGVYRSTHG